MGMQVLREIGYARVSTDDQDCALQVAALRGVGCEFIFTENMSGTKKSRPALDAMLAMLQDGDRVNVWKVDRLGRSTVNSLLFVQELIERKVSFRSITQNFDTSTPTGMLMLQMLLIFAEFERNTIVERTNAGLAAAREQGAIGGNRRAFDKQTLARAREAYANRPISPATGRPMTGAELAASFGVNRSTFLRWADPNHFTNGNKDAAAFRARHPDLESWLDESGEPGYGRSVRNRAAR